MSVLLGICQIDYGRTAWNVRSTSITTRLCPAGRNGCPNRSSTKIGSSCGIGVGKETCRIEIFGVALAEDNLCQIRRKVGLGHRSRENVCAWPAGVEDRGDGHAVFSTRFPGSSGSSSASVHESPGVSNREARDRSRRAWSVRARPRRDPETVAHPSVARSEPPRVCERAQARSQRRCRPGVLQRRWLCSRASTASGPEVAWPA